MPPVSGPPPGFAAGAQGPNQYNQLGPGYPGQGFGPGQQPQSKTALWVVLGCVLGVVVLVILAGVFFLLRSGSDGPTPRADSTTSASPLTSTVPFTASSSPATSSSSPTMTTSPVTTSSPIGEDTSGKSYPLSRTFTVKSLSGTYPTPPAGMEKQGAKTWVATSPDSNAVVMVEGQALGIGEATDDLLLTKRAMREATSKMSTGTGLTTPTSITFSTSTGGTVEGLVEQFNANMDGTAGTVMVAARAMGDQLMMVMYLDTQADFDAAQALKALKGMVVTVEE